MRGCLAQAAVASHHHPHAQRRRSPRRRSGRPGAAVAWIGERYKPELFWVAADRRSASWIVDVTDAGQLHELVHITARKAATTPELRPIVLDEEAARAIPAAMKVAAGAP